MKFAVLGVAIAAGAGAVYLVQSELDRARVSATMVRPEPAPQPAPEATPRVQVLVATGRFQRGHILRERDLQWREWPEDVVAEAFITQPEAPNAVADLVGAVVRTSLSAGEPIVEDKVIDVDHPGALAALLRPGMRGFAIEISPETGAGGLIVPGNYVDIVLTRSDDIEYIDASGERQVRSVLFTDTLIRTARVVAVDIVLSDDDGVAEPDGKTLTLEITAEQVELLSLAEQAGRLTVAVRSIADLVDDKGERIPDPFPTLAVDLETFAGASLAFSSDANATKTAAGESPEDGLEVTILRFNSLSRATVPAASGDAPR